MELGIWPLPNAKADALLGAYLDRAMPGWRLQARWEDQSGDAVGAVLWEFLAVFKPDNVAGAASLAEEAADTRLEEIAMGAPMDFANLSLDALAILRARLLVAITGATAASMTPGPVMRLPHGLSEAQLRRAVALRTLYQAPLSIAGLG